MADPESHILFVCMFGGGGGGGFQNFKLLSLFFALTLEKSGKKYTIYSNFSPIKICFLKLDKLVHQKLRVGTQ